jgi:hypothetical protein
MTHWEGPGGLRVEVATVTGSRARQTRAFYLISRPAPGHPGGRLGEQAATMGEVTEKLARRGVSLAALREVA